MHILTDTIKIKVGSNMLLFNVVITTTVSSSKHVFITETDRQKGVVWECLWPQ